MEKLTSLGLDFDKVLIQLLIPGLTAFMPWMLYFIYFYYYEIEYIIDNITLSIALVATISLVVGLIIENIGSRIEVAFYDKKNGSDNETWEKYLRLKYTDAEPIGQRYIRTILVRMKFEVSFGLALISTSIGLFYLDYRITIFESIYYKLAFFYFLPISLAVYLICFEGFASSKVLAKTRKLLVDKYYV